MHIDNTGLDETKKVEAAAAAEAAYLVYKRAIEAAAAAYKAAIDAAVLAAYAAEPEN